MPKEKMKFFPRITILLICLSTAQCQEVELVEEERQLVVTASFDKDIKELRKEFTSAAGVDVLIREIYKSCQAVTLRGGIPCEKVYFIGYKNGKKHEFILTWNKAESNFSFLEVKGKGGLENDDEFKIEGVRVPKDGIEKP